MILICPRCQTENERDARFCKTCGTGFNVQPIRRNSISTPLIVILAVIAVCGFCSIFGLVNQKNEVAQTNAPVRQFSSANTANNQPSAPISGDPAPPKKSLAGKTATVISENANLRETPSSGGAIVQTVPRDAQVEIVRQQGGWFYVNTAGVGGWMHGNTIRLDDADRFNQSPQMPVQTYKPPRVQERSDPIVNNPGATARCSDGTLSYSAHRRGTCSHHGGVAEWY